MIRALIFFPVLFSNLFLFASADSLKSFRFREFRVGYGFTVQPPFSFALKELRSCAPNCEALNADYSGFYYTRTDGESTKTRMVTSRGSYWNRNIPVSVSWVPSGENSVANKHISLEAGFNYSEFVVTDFFGVKTEQISSNTYYYTDGLYNYDYSVDSNYQTTNSFFWRTKLISGNLGICFHANNKLGVDLVTGAFLSYGLDLSSSLEITSDKKRFILTEGTKTSLANGQVTDLTGTQEETVEYIESRCEIPVSFTRIYIPFRMGFYRLFASGKGPGIYAQYTVGREKMKMGNYTVTRLNSTIHFGLAYRLR